MHTTATVIYIDDDTEDWEMLGDVLHSLELTLNILHLQDGQQGWDYLQHCKQQQRMPSLVILDLNMPRINGMELLRMMKADALLEHLPVVAVSTSATEKADLQRMGVSLINKPGDMQAFTAAIQQVLAGIGLCPSNGREPG